jgi:alginate O-acetyltransferase complex protein AlgI
VNYNSFAFWLLFGLLYALYWRLDHRRQNTLLLVASYIFYGTWDYRFLFLILVSTAIDFIGGLGVAGVTLPRRKLQGLAALVVGSAFVLCSGVQYPVLARALVHADGAGVAAALPHRLADLGIPLAVTVVTALYGALLPWMSALPRDRRRKVFLTVSMIANLGILGFFKYCDFFAGSFVDLLHVIGFGDVHWTVLGLILPAGISFYTFQAMSYTIDIYRGDAEPTERFGDFALFVCFFPHLVAGPIMRAHTLLPQVVNPRRDPRGTLQMREGLALVLIGLCKKLVIADNMASIANSVFFRFTDGTAAGVSGPEALLGLYAFAFQIYGDFSGYSAIARGISKWLGFELAENFHLPYLAISPSDFWRRWHISLSSWLRDYLYIPLGGNRRGVVQQYRNLALTMLLGGLWHGASFTYIVWGAFHGGILCVYRLLGVSDKIDRAGARGWLHWAFRVALMFHLTCLGWLFFRADNFGAAWSMLGRIVTDWHFERAALAAPAMEMLVLALIPMGLEAMLDGERDVGRLWRSSRLVETATYAYALVMLLFLRAGQVHEFIYFQF